MRWAASKRAVMNNKLTQYVMGTPAGEQIKHVNRLQLQQLCICVIDLNIHLY